MLEQMQFAKVALSRRPTLRPGQRITTAFRQLNANGALGDSDASVRRLRPRKQQLCALSDALEKSLYCEFINEPLVSVRHSILSSIEEEDWDILLFLRPDTRAQVKCPPLQATLPSQICTAWMPANWQ